MLVDPFVVINFMNDHSLVQKSRGMGFGCIFVFVRSHVNNASHFGLNRLGLILNISSIFDLCLTCELELATDKNEDKDKGTNSAV